MSARVEELEKKVAALNAELRDLRDQVDASDALRGELESAEELNRRILEIVPGGIVWVSIDGSIRHANPDAQRILGLSFDEITSNQIKKYLENVHDHLKTVSLADLNDRGFQYDISFAKFFAKNYGINRFDLEEEDLSSEEEE